ncbi:MAG: ABC transporter permease [Methanomethylophilus sp.]|nr:ABC transporter permease [Methanomethylophilus sp.]MDD4221569.1 ABC transporter permease [Methanomethylophilus sp.]MDD4668728.1 ABC transporter permease [Methanomethylophilus sp.]
MSALTNIVSKELRELLTPGTILSVVVVVVMLGILGTALSGEVESTATPSDIGIVYDDTGMYSEQMQDDLAYGYAAVYGTTTDAATDHMIYLTVAETDSDAILQAITDRGLAYVIVIPSALSANIAVEQTTSASVYYIYENSGLFDDVSSSAANSVVYYAANQLSQQLTGEITGEAAAAFLAAPLAASGGTYTQINGTLYSDIAPSTISTSMMSQTLMVPLIVMIVIIMVGSVVISSMGSEKENKTLETLLTVPIRRTTIVTGKLLAAAICGLIYGIAYMIGMLLYMRGLTTATTLDGTADLAAFGLTMTGTDWILLMVLLFLAIFAALGICMILGAFTKNYKMAQTMIMPVSILAIIPMFVFMFMSWDGLGTVGQALMFLIPFTHPMMAMNNLIFGNYTLIAAGAAYLVVFDVIMIWLTVRIYNSDILITGIDQTKTARTLKRLFGKKKHHDDEQ